MSNVLSFYQEFDFYLTISEYFALVWLYRNEVKPALLEPEQVRKTQNVQSPDTNDLFRKARHLILSGEFSNYEFSYIERVYLSKSFPLLFAPFDKEQMSISKPAIEQLRDMRGKICDLIQQNMLGNLPEIKSPIVDGKMRFKMIFERVFQ